MRVILLLLAALVAGSASAEETLRTVGVLAHRGDDAARKRWQPTLDAVSGAIPDVRFELVPLSLDGVRSALSRGEIDYLFTNPGHFHRLSERFPLSPIVALRTDRQGSVSTGNRFGAVIFTRSDNSAIATLADLRGRKFAAVAPDAFGGFEVAAAALLHNGVDPWRDFDSVAFLGFPQEKVIDAVIAGAADAGTVRTGVLEAAVKTGRIEAYDVRVLNPLSVPGFDLALSTALVPEWLICATGNVGEPERRNVALALLGLESDHPAVAAGRYGGWTTVPSGTTVRELLATVDAARNSSATSGIPTTLTAGLALAFLACLALVIVMSMRARQKALSAPTPASASPSPAVHLTPRESEILALVGHGKTTKEIARDLGISPKTVEFHRGHLMRKFDAHNMAELIRKATGSSESAVQTGPS